MPPMKLTDFLWAGVLSLLPISELRGGIPYAMTVGGAPWWLAFLYCVGMNALAAPIAFIFLNTVHKLFYRWNWYKKLFDRFVERARKKIEGPVEKFGYWGLMIFVAIPLPFTGAWTGALGAWILGMKTRKSMAFVILGVVVAGVIVTAIMALGIKGFDIFIKQA
jgi:uncharacterized membrane protein